MSLWAYSAGGVMGGVTPGRVRGTVLCMPTSGVNLSARPKSTGFATSEIRPKICQTNYPEHSGILWALDLSTLYNQTFKVEVDRASQWDITHTHTKKKI
jgi:hypothetical protein